MKKIILCLLMLVVTISIISCTTNETINKITNEVTNEITNKVVDYEDITITDMENAVITGIERAEKAVVGVSLKSVESLQNGSSSENAVSTGSGVIYKMSENYEGDTLVNYTYYVITNRHVIEESSIANPKVYIYLGYENVQIEATVVGYDQKVDIALLTFDHTTYIQPVEFADSDELKKGTFVIAIGNPNGYDYFGSSTFGIVSSPNRFLSSDTDGDNVYDFNCPYIQHDASINPGNSGGGLFTIDGKLVGINTIKLVSSNIENMGFAIPSNEVKFLVENYLEKGLTIQRAKLGILGIEMRVLTNAYIVQNGLKEIPNIYGVNEIPYGIYVNEIFSGSTISNSEIKVHDIILEFDGVKIRNNSDLSALLNSASKYKVGSVVELTYFSRSLNKVTTTSVTLKA